MAQADEKDSVDLDVVVDEALYPDPLNTFILNAIYDAVGVRITSLPADKKKVKKLGIKHKQDSVLTQTKKTATLHRTRKGGLDKKGENVGRFKPQGKNPYGQSQIKGKTFSYGD